MSTKLSASIVGVLATCIIASSAARADSALIVAIGADNTAGYGTGSRHGGVGRSKAYPAQLEAMLHSRGIDAHVFNAGKPHDTTAGILNRLDNAVPNETRLVILNPAKGDDLQQGLEEKEHGYIEEIRQKLEARHIPLIVLPELGKIASHRDYDGHHFTAEGHAEIAAYLLPKVVEVLGR